MSATTLVWLVRFAHVAAAALWAGGYALLACYVMPRMVRAPGPEIARIAMGMVRLLTYSGSATIFFGVLLVGRTRRYDALGGGEWGMLVGASAAVATALLGVGEGFARPALRRFPEPGMTVRAQRWILAAFLLSLLGIALMTRAVYAGS